MDYRDPTVTDGLARDREVILFNTAGVSSSSGVSFLVGAPDSSKPASPITAITSPWTRAPGSVPADTARGPTGSARALNQCRATES